MKPLAFFVDDNGCWIPNRVQNPNGYVKVKRDGKQVSLHRYMYIKHHGPIPDDMVIMHTCDNKPCSNPDHLICGTQKDNIQDSLKKGRKPVGEKHWNSKITTEQVVEIKRLLQQGYYNCREIAEVLNVGYFTIKDIKRKKTWKHVRIA